MMRYKGLFLFALGLVALAGGMEAYALPVPYAGTYVPSSTLLLAAYLWIIVGGIWHIVTSDSWPGAYTDLLLVAGLVLIGLSMSHIAIVGLETSAQAALGIALTLGGVVLRSLVAIALSKSHA